MITSTESLAGLFSPTPTNFQLQAAYEAQHKTILDPPLDKPDQLHSTSFQFPNPLCSGKLKMKQKMNDEQKAEEIKRLLVKYNIRQEQIAKRAQVSRPGVCRAISGLSRSRKIMAVIWEMLKERSADESVIAFLLNVTQRGVTEHSSLKQLLKKAGITQTYIAQKAQVTPATVSLTVTGKSRSRHIEKIIREEVAKAGVMLDTEDSARNSGVF
ncbi:MAG: hypothetical protein ACQEUB_13760 [Thermodesulfobacteriota bacterium]